MIITNQSGIARGYYGEEDFQRLTDWMLSDLATRGIRIDGVYYCPHHPEGRIERYRQDCDCRKPKTGLFHRAAQELGIDMSQSIAVGDKMRDLAICQEMGMKGILISDGQEAADGIILCRNWREIISAIGGMRS